MGLHLVCVPVGSDQEQCPCHGLHASHLVPRVCAFVVVWRLQRGKLQFAKAMGAIEPEFQYPLRTQQRHTREVAARLVEVTRGDPEMQKVVSQRLFTLYNINPDEQLGAAGKKLQDFQHNFVETLKHVIQFLKGKTGRTANEKRAVLTIIYTLVAHAAGPASTHALCTPCVDLVGCSGCSTHPDTACVEVRVNPHTTPEVNESRSFMSMTGTDIASRARYGEILAVETESDLVPWMLVKVESQVRPVTEQELAANPKLGSDITFQLARDGCNNLAFEARPLRPKKLDRGGHSATQFVENLAEQRMLVPAHLVRVKHGDLQIEAKRKTRQSEAAGVVEYTLKNRNEVLARCRDDTNSDGVF